MSKSICNVIKKIFKNSREYLQEILIFIIFCLITFIATFPLLLNIKTSIFFYDAIGDSMGAIWNIWWMKYTWLNNLSSRFIPILASPFGIDLSASFIPSTSDILWRALAILVDEIFTYNIILFLSFPVSAMTMYFLTKYFTQNKLSCIAAGIIYGFCPYHFAHTSHLSLLSTQWMPLYVLLLFWLIEKPCYKNAFFCSLGFSLVMLENHYYGYFMSIYTLIFFLFMCWSYRRSRDELSRLIKISAVFLFLITLILFPFIYPPIKTMLSTTSVDIKSSFGFIRPFKDLFVYSAKPWDYLLPSAIHPIFGKYVKGFIKGHLYGSNLSEQTLFLGYIPLTLAGIAIWKWKTDISPVNSKITMATSFFVFATIVMVWFSAPPYIPLGEFRIENNEIISKYKFYFPSFFMYKFFPMIRVYARLGIVVMMGISVLAGIGMKYLSEKLTGQKTKDYITIAVIFCILFEFGSFFPHHLKYVDKPSQVYEWLAKKPEDFTIVEYPLKRSSDALHYEYIFNQRYHKKRLVNGSIPGTEAYEVSQKILDITKSEVTSILKKLGVSYVLVHPDKYKIQTSTTPKKIEVFGVKYNVPNRHIKEKVPVPSIGANPNLRLVKEFKNTWVYEIY